MIPSRKARSGQSEPHSQPHHPPNLPFYGRPHPFSPPNQCAHSLSISRDPPAPRTMPVLPPFLPSLHSFLQNNFTRNELVSRYYYCSTLLLHI
ncbi:hypothetical protein BO85DRAFT_8928 [Aspergillus piperis CBS 112811]|uniref:Uncharacterized protein n=1 Tax=Aspergillus piperis CBS 112811 TaxID=1448313 RepID=A0A8G1RDQ4_9EURO|nr:hypothetical protein BO85DRAFT_8928 [Aspergillus piperis CBS 112811]RAH62819.1 hypothetical protein BO85DRAFT_8928 [Aspergillus piperis CBS 112811]